MASNFALPVSTRSSSSPNLFEYRLLYPHQAYEAAVEHGHLNPTLDLAASPGALHWVPAVDILAAIPNTFFPAAFANKLQQLDTLATAGHILVLTNAKCPTWLKAFAAASRLLELGASTIAPQPNARDNTSLFKGPAIKVIIKQLLPGPESPPVLISLPQLQLFYGPSQELHIVGAARLPRKPDCGETSGEARGQAGAHLPRPDPRGAAARRSRLLHRQAVGHGPARLHGTAAVRLSAVGHYMRGGGQYSDEVCE